MQDTTGHATMQDTMLAAVPVTPPQNNAWTGEHSYGVRSLHALSPGELNPYQQVIKIIARTLACFDDDGQIPWWVTGVMCLLAVQLLHVPYLSCNRDIYTGVSQLGGLQGVNRQASTGRVHPRTTARYLGRLQGVDRMRGNFQFIKKGRVPKKCI
jgi:hypothetical protein